MRAIEEFVEGLRGIPEAEFTIPRVTRSLRETPVDPASLAPYLHYTPTHYTRNLIYKGDLFEVLAICWEVGQVSRIHNHQGQHCWMTVPTGRLLVQNYELLWADGKTGACELREADRYLMDPEHPGVVEPERPIHSVLNLPEYGQRAASLHIYSRPYSSCLVYSLEKTSYVEAPLFYDTEYGRPAAPRPSGR